MYQHAPISTKHRLPSICVNHLVLNLRQFEPSGNILPCKPRSNAWTYYSAGSDRFSSSIVFAEDPAAGSASSQLPRLTSSCLSPSRHNLSIEQNIVSSLVVASAHSGNELMVLDLERGLSGPYISDFESAYDPAGPPGHDDVLSLKTHRSAVSVLLLFSTRF